MLKKDLDKIKWKIGNLRIDSENLKAYIVSKDNQEKLLLQDGLKVKIQGQVDAEFRNIESIGCFISNGSRISINDIEERDVWTCRSIYPDLKDFLKEYVDLDTLNILVDGLSKYDVTLYDCTFFTSHEGHTEKGYINGANSAQFFSDNTFGYCYLIHRFKIDESIGLSVQNEFEFISIEGNRYIKKYELELSEEEISEGEDFERQLLDYYNYKEIDPE